MTYKVKSKKYKVRKLTKQEYGFYQKGYFDASVGNRKAYTKKDTGKGYIYG